MSHKVPEEVQSTGNRFTENGESQKYNGKHCENHDNQTKSGTLGDEYHTDHCQHQRKEKEDTSETPAKKHGKESSKLGSEIIGKQQVRHAIAPTAQAALNLQTERRARVRTP